MLALILPCSIISMRGSVMDRLLGLELAGPITSLSFLILAEAFNRSIYFDLALVYTLLSFVSTLVVVRFLERWV
jgi:multicomponent Na+:H+ antiporter subunit F